MEWNAEQFCIDYGIQYWTSGKNIQSGWIGISCPFHIDSNHGGFNPFGGYYHCWHCGWSPLKDVVSELLNIPKENAYKIIKKYESSFIVRSLIKKKRARANNVLLPGGSLLECHRNYLLHRGYDPDFIVSKYKITGTGPAGENKLRVIIPIIYKNRVVCWQGRDVTNKQKLRYSNSALEKSIMNAKELLYNLDNCQKNYIFVVEGVFDVWRFGDNFTATLGTSTTDVQVNLLSNYKKVAIIFDPEKAAQKKAKDLAVKLSSFGVETTIIDLEINCDPGDIPQKEANKIKKDLINAFS